MKDNPNVQNHTIHIGELMKSARMSAFVSHKQSSSNSSASSHTRHKIHKRVKSHNFINSVPDSNVLFNKHSLMFKNNLKGLSSSNQTNCTDLHSHNPHHIKKISTDRHLGKNTYVVRKQKKKAFSKKNSLATSKKNFIHMKSKKLGQEL